MNKYGLNLKIAKKTCFKKLSYLHTMSVSVLSLQWKHDSFLQPAETRFNVYRLLFYSVRLRFPAQISFPCPIMQTDLIWLRRHSGAVISQTSATLPFHGKCSAGWFMNLQTWNLVSWLCSYQAKKDDGPTTWHTMILIVLFSNAMEPKAIQQMQQLKWKQKNYIKLINMLIIKNSFTNSLHFYTMFFLLSRVLGPFRRPIFGPRRYIISVFSEILNKLTNKQKIWVNKHQRSSQCGATFDYFFLLVHICFLTFSIWVHYTEARSRGKVRLYEKKEAELSEAIFLPQSKCLPYKNRELIVHGQVWW